MSRMEATIYSVKEVVLIGRTAEGETVMFSKWKAGDTATAQIGDVFSFVPDAPKNPKATVNWFGKCPKLVSQAAPSQPVEALVEPLAGGFARLAPMGGGDFRNAHAKHFDQRGEIIFWPRPIDLAAQRAGFLRKSS